MPLPAVDDLETNNENLSVASTSASDLATNPEEETSFQQAVLAQASEEQVEDEPAPRQPVVKAGLRMGYTDGGENGNSGVLSSVTFSPASPIAEFNDGATTIVPRLGINRNDLTTPDGGDVSNTILSPGLRATHRINDRLSVYADQQLDFKSNDSAGDGPLNPESITSYSSVGANLRVVDGETTDVDLGVRGRVVTGLNTENGNFNDASWRAALMPQVTHSVGPNTSLFAGGFAEARSTGGDPFFLNGGIKHQAGDIGLSAEYRRNITGPAASSEPFGNQNGENMIFLGINGTF